MTVTSCSAAGALPDESASHEAADSGQRLRASPAFALAFGLDGRPYVLRQMEPYTQYWLTEPERVLLSLFGGRRGETVERAIEAYLRLADRQGGAREISRLGALVGQMRAMGLLVGVRDEASPYEAAMATEALKHRPFPAELAQLIVREGPVGETSRVLDLAGGPGGVALALATASRHVALMDMSRGFITAADAEARRRGLDLKLHHHPLNRLTAHEETYDVVTVSPALNRRDDVLTWQGVERVLHRGGCLFVVLSGIGLGDDHPLAYLLGDPSILGPRPTAPFGDLALARLRRLSLLLEALHAPESGGGEPVGAVGLQLFRQTRPFGLGYARASISPRQVEATGMEYTAFWADLDLRCVMATPRQLLGVQDWALLQFRRGAEPWIPPAAAPPPIEIGWSGPFDD